jgi:hypothetical protein
MTHFNPKRDPKPRHPASKVGMLVALANCRQHDRVMGLATDIEAEVEFVRITAAGRVAVIYWTAAGTSYRELDPGLQVKLVRRQAVVS